MEVILVISGNRTVIDLCGYNPVALRAFLVSENRYHSSILHPFVGLLKDIGLLAVLGHLNPHSIERSCSPR